MRKLHLTTFYRRDKYRDDNNSLFNTKKYLSFFSNTSSMIFLTPTVMISSLFTHTALLMAINIFLSLGFMFNFFHRIYLKEVSYFEFFMTFVVIAALVLFAFYLMPVMPSTSLIGILCIANIFSSSINSFFLIRDVVIPPFIPLIRQLLNQLGFSISIAYFNIHPLDIERDRVVIERLLKISSSKPISYPLEDLDAYNNLIKKICSYINKYEEPFLGYITRQDEIKKLDEAVNKLVKDGESEAALRFINKKISFKEAKIRQLNKAKQLLDPEEPNSVFSLAKMSIFFKPLQKEDENNLETKAVCMRLLTAEIEKQEKKLNELDACRPKACK